MTYTRINSIGKRELTEEVSWDGGISELQDIFYDVIREIGFKPSGKGDKFSDYDQLYLTKDKVSVSVETFLLNNELKIDIKYYHNKLDRMADFSTFLFTLENISGQERYKFYRIIKNNMTNPETHGELNNIFEIFFNDIRESWRESNTSFGGFL